MTATRDYSIDEAANELRGALESVRALGIQWITDFPPAFLAALEILPSDPLPRIREQVRVSLLTLIDELPASDRIVFLEAAGFRRGAPRSRGARLQAAKDAVQVSERTVYRVIDAAIDQLVALMQSAQQRSKWPDLDYAFLSSCCRVDLTEDQPRVTTERCIVSRVEDLEYIEERVGFHLLPARN